MTDVIDIVRPFVRRGLFASAEKAVAQMARDYVLRQIERYRAVDDRLQTKYGMTYEQFEAYLQSRSDALATAPDPALNQAVMIESEFFLGHHHTPTPAVHGRVRAFHPTRDKVSVPAS